MANLNEFGSSWTETKLSILRKYLSFYTKALSRQPFTLVYIDGFAGTGECTIKLANGEKLTIPGSAQIALDNKPPFKHLIFIEQDERKVEALQELCNQKEAICKPYIFHNDANKELVRACRFLDKRRMRAVAFIDPFGMEIHWKTLESLASTKCVDMIFLFSLSGLYRQVERKIKEDFDEHKASSLDLFLGTESWRSEFYEEEKQTNLFGEPEGYRRKIDYMGMLEFAKKRMGEIFPFISEPLLLPQKGAPQFALFLAVSSDNPKAFSLAQRVYADITKKYK